MNKKILFGLAALMLSVLACSFGSVNPNAVIGSGKVVTETRSVSGFSAVVLQGSASVDVTFGATESVVVSADDNIVPLIETTVQNGKLVIGTKDNTSITTINPVRVSVTMKSLQGLVLSGSGNLTVSGLTVSGLTADALTVELSGSGTIRVDGSADNLTVSLPGSGNVYCKDLTARSVTVKLLGSGNIEVFASESLDATILGSGSIRYDGNPAHVTKKVTGSGSILP